MELQTKRWLERFLQLVELPSDGISAKMEFLHPCYRFYIEYINNNIILTVGKKVELVYQENILEKLLTQCIPARTKGTLLRPWVGGGYQMLSCQLNTTSSISHWVYCFKTMQRLLDEAIGLK
ncbi:MULTISPECIES: type III secretion chaperone SycN [Providencia]|uniref:type III secretion chaperone SycN n=1 Tax=Providencia TaxID=586 RepID=UPI001C22A410|nr:MULTISPECIES: type III secretion chaperone SycN [Providencia]QXB90060.1 type III secretion chaperone SycN [Providencia rettgeri]